MAMMLGSADLLRAWVLSTLAGLATDDEHHARLRDTLLTFLQSGGSYKATAERLMRTNPNGSSRASMFARVSRISLGLPFKCRVT